jgi:mxaA protein
MPMPSPATSIRERRMKARAIPALLTAWVVVGAQAADVPGVHVQEPRAFGYSVGDVVARVVMVDVPSGLEIDEASLPDSSMRGRAIELRRLTNDSTWRPGGRRHELTLEYQVLLAPPEVRTLELPPITLRLAPSSTGRNAPREQDLRVDAWPVTVSPLTPPEARTREGLGEWRPDRPPPLFDTTAGRRRLVAYAAVAAVLLGYLGLVYLWLPWWAPRRRPFGVAWRALRQANPASAEQRREAFRRLHGALNQTAGRVVFESDLGAFIAQHPQFAGLREELASFFQRSRQQFFAGAAPSDDPGHGDWLLRFCRACRDAERGTS